MIDINKVRNLLVQYFGPGHINKLIDENNDSIIPPVGSKEKTYYFSVPGMDDVIQIRNLLRENRDAASFRQMTIKLNQYEAMAAVLEREAYRWRIYFYPISEIVLYRRYRHIALRIEIKESQTHKQYYLNADEGTELYGFFRKYPYDYDYEYSDGESYNKMNYSLNKLCWNSKQFRGFAASFIELCAETNHENFWRDVARTIREQGLFFSPLDYSRIRNCHTIKEYLLELSPLFEEYGTMTHTNLNTLSDLNFDYLIARALPTIARSNWKDLIQLKPTYEKLCMIYPEDQVFEHGIRMSSIIGWYYSSRLGRNFEDGGYVQQFAADYYSQCVSAEIPCRITISSLKSLRNEHDDVMRFLAQKKMEQEDLQPLVREGSQFDLLETYISMFPEEYGKLEWVKDNKRLFEVGNRMKNCVYTRRSLCIRDDAAILQWHRSETEEYTIQVEREKTQTKKFFIREMKGIGNGYPIPDAFEIIEKHFVDPLNKSVMKNREYLEFDF